MGQDVFRDTGRSGAGISGAGPSMFALCRSIENAGLDPDNLPEADKTTMDFGSGGGSKAKAWRDIWGAGQGVERAARFARD